MFTNHEDAECPLCMELFDVDDQSFFPCTCGYQICRFCWHRIRTDENGLCPACRKLYHEDPAEFKPVADTDVLSVRKERKQRECQRRQKAADNRKHLANIRVVQRNLVFVVGLSPRIADPDILRKHEYFGKFGKILKVVINNSTSYAGAQGPSASAYVTYANVPDALRAVLSVNNAHVDGRTLKTSLGTTKYCSHFLKSSPCNKSDCMYLHELGEESASFTKEDMQAGKHQEYEQKLIDQFNSCQISTANHVQTKAQHERKKSGGEPVSNHSQSDQHQAQHIEKSDSQLQQCSHHSPSCEMTSNSLHKQSQLLPFDSSDTSGLQCTGEKLWPLSGAVHQCVASCASCHNHVSAHTDVVHTHGVAFCWIDSKETSHVSSETEKTETVEHPVDSMSSIMTSHIDTSDPFPSTHSNDSDHCRISPLSVVSVTSTDVQNDGDSHSLHGACKMSDSPSCPNRLECQMPLNTSHHLAMFETNNLSFFTDNIRSSKLPPTQQQMPNADGVTHTEMSDSIPVTSSEDWSAAFGFKESDDDLEFDPCAESINGLADLVEKEKKRLAGCVNGIDCSYMSFASHALDRRSSVSGTLSQSAPPGFSISGQHSHPYHNADLSNALINHPQMLEYMLLHQDCLDPISNMDVNNYSMLDDLHHFHSQHHIQSQDIDQSSLQAMQKQLRAMLPNINIHFSPQASQHSVQHQDSTQLLPANQHQSPDCPHWLKSLHQLTEIEVSPHNDSHYDVGQQYSSNGGWWTQDLQSPPPGFHNSFTPAKSHPESHKMAEGE